MATVLYATDPAAQGRLRRRFRKGELARIRRGIYVDSHDAAEIEKTLNSQWREIATHLFDQPVAVFRTAAELRPAKGHVYLAVKGAARRTVPAGSLRFIVADGDVELGVEPFTPEMKRSDSARQVLENLVPARAKSGVRKTLGRDWVESQLVLEVERRGEPGLNRLRDEARALAPALRLEREFDALDKMVSAILNTHPGDGVLQTRATIARVAGAHFDEDRRARFEALADYLRRIELPALPCRYSKAAWRNLTFFESYFSNYIEGTRFTIDEAEEIAGSGRAIRNRHEDSHDILSHIEISGDTTEMHRVPGSADDLIGILKIRHGILLAQRPDKRPGQFKLTPNQAGATVFVAPDKVEGTLAQGFRVYKSLPAGIKRALYMHFLVAECHPFDDGNGRLARIMMNAEMVVRDQFRIIVPSVCRDNYLGGLRQASRQDRFRVLVKVLHQLHQYTASIDWDDYQDARHRLETHAANQDPDDGLMAFNKVLRQFGGNYPAG